MSAHELATRLSQEFSKRADLAMYRAGVDTVRNSIIDVHGPTPKFFFSPDEIGQRAELLKKYLPEAVEETLRAANNACRHRFDLLGYKDVDYGEKIDWHLDAIHGKRAPREPWYTIPFLDFEVVGDHKVTWELNRHQHLVTLAKAWCFTGDERFVSEILSQWYDWQKENPYPIGINWGSSLEVAFRCLSWIWMRQLLANCSSLPAQFDRDLLRGLARNGRYIESFLSTYFSPNTHLIGEALGLFFVGVLCPKIRLAPRWRRDGWRMLQEEAQRQVRDDGVYFEQALHYHVYALDFFLHARVLAERNGLPIPAAYDEVLNKMLDVLAALSQVGPPLGFGDDDGGRLFDPQRNQAEHMGDPLAIGGLAYGRNELLPLAQLTEEAIWVFGEKAVSLGAEPIQSSRARSVAFPDGGIYAIADPQERSLMVIDAGPQGTGRCGHGHADALSVRFSSGDRNWLIDPGTCSYISNNGMRSVFRSTAAHNTIQVDKQDQAVQEGPFAWSSIPRTTVERWVAGESFDYFVGNHDGYSRLADPVIHRRFVFHAHGGPWLIRDVLMGKAYHEIEAWWHFAEDLQVELKDKGFVAAASSGAKLELLWAASAGAGGSVEAGMIAPAYGNQISAGVARLKIEAQLPLEIGWLVAHPAEDVFTESFGMITREAGVSAYSYERGPVTNQFFLSNSKEPWECGGWASDAEFVWSRLSEGRPTQVIMVGGTFLRHQNRTLVHNSRPHERFEWTERASDELEVRADR